ncbi:hypothetical protein JFQ93_003993 [Aeromonas sobria]|nr:hypothetical protein [Aeromonas sobria]
MRIYGKNEAGEAVYIADCRLPQAAYAELDSGRSFHYELLPAKSLGTRDEKSGAVIIACILLEPYRLYRNNALIEMGAMIAEPLHVKMLAGNIQQRAVARQQVQTIADSWAAEPQGRE